VLFDGYGYFGTYQNFISRRDAVQFSGGQAGSGTPSYYSIVVNAPGDVKTYGWGMSLDYILPGNFRIGGNVSSDVLDDVPDGFRAFFNAPKYRTNVTFANDGFGKKKIVGFNLSWRWQDEVEWQGDFANGLVQEFNVVDASVNFKVPKSKSMVKVGANNLLNSYYRTGVGNPSVGGLYYVSFAFNVL
jgi:hypothetical protein